MIRESIFSGDRRYRFTLWREWLGGSGFAMFIGLNPSTADELTDDPTIRRCVNFAKAWGFTALCMTNLFALRATRPVDLLAHPDPIGTGNDAILVAHAQEAAIVVAAWGNDGGHLRRDRAVCDSIPNLHHLGLTNSGFPRHPLYLPKATMPKPWRIAKAIADGENQSSP